MDRLKQLFVRLWPTIFGPQPVVTEPEVDRIVVPPEPMYRDPMGGDWEQL